jgi:hypothetical protein
VFLADTKGDAIIAGCTASCHCGGVEANETCSSRSRSLFWLSLGTGQRLQYYPRTALIASHSRFSSSAAFPWDLSELVYDVGQGPTSETLLHVSLSAIKFCAERLDWLMLKSKRMYMGAVYITRAFQGKPPSRLQRLPDTFLAHGHFKPRLQFVLNVYLPLDQLAHRLPAHILRILVLVRHELSKRARADGEHGLVHVP